MNVNDLLKGFDCSCGKHHTCPIDYVYVEKGAAAHLAEIFKSDNEILIVADENTYAAAGKDVTAALEGKTIRQIIFTGKEILVPDEKAIDAVEKELYNASAIVGVGSGVIQDLCKYVSFDKNIPYAVVATAPSMDGYASNGAAMILGGMKVTVAATLPRAILADPAVLCNSPMEMIRAGYGDIIGKFSALNDWKLSHVINDEYFCKWIYDITMEQVDRTMALANGLLCRDEEAVATLMEALVVVGIMMSFAGTSRPASGSEHHLSHFFEITGILENKPYFSHGIDVAYSTVVTAAIREKILANPIPKECYKIADTEYESEMKRVYSTSAEGCIKLQKKVGHYSTDRTKTYLEKEKEIREVLSAMPSAKEVEDILSAAGYNIKEFYDLYGEAKINDAVKWAKDLKDRFTVLWLNYDFYKGERI